MNERKIALVTGASRGMGLEWCRQLGKQGYLVILTARELNQAQSEIEELFRKKLPVYPKILDVTNESHLRVLSAWVKETFGKLDLIVNNAGINPKDFTEKTKMAKAFYLDELDADVMLEIIRINSIAPLLVSKHFRALLQKSEQPVILNISSWLGSVTNLSFGGHYGYVGSKSLLNTLNKSLAMELKKDNIISVSVNPGWVQTDMGGSRAHFTPEQAVINMYENLLSKLTIQDTGRFLNYDGNVHPW